MTFSKPAANHNGPLEKAAQALLTSGPPCCPHGSGVISACLEPWARAALPEGAGVPSPHCPSSRRARVSCAFAGSYHTTSPPGPPIHLVNSAQGQRDAHGWTELFISQNRSDYATGLCSLRSRQGSVPCRRGDRNSLFSRSFQRHSKQTEYESGRADKETFRTSKTDKGSTRIFEDREKKGLKIQWTIFLSCFLWEVCISDIQCELHGVLSNQWLKEWNTEHLIFTPSQPLTFSQLLFYYL